MTTTESGIQMDRQGNFILQSLTSAQKSGVQKDFHDAQWLVDDFVDGKRQPEFEGETEQDYGKPCDMCSKANIWVKKKTVRSNLHCQIQLVIQACKGCKAIKHKFYIVTSNPLSQCYQVDVVGGKTR